MTEHKRIWLEPAEQSDPFIGRSWCQDNQWGDEGVEYVLASTLESLQRENEELRQAKWQQKHVDTMNDMVAMGMARDAAEDEVKRLRGLLDGLCAWLLHRFGPDSPEGREASSRTALASTGGEHHAE